MERLRRSFSQPPTDEHIAKLRTYGVMQPPPSRYGSGALLSFLESGGPGYDRRSVAERVEFFQGLQRLWNGRRVVNRFRKRDGGTVLYVFPIRLEERVREWKKTKRVGGVFRVIVQWDDHTKSSLLFREIILLAVQAA